MDNHFLITHPSKGLQRKQSWVECLKSETIANKTPAMHRHIFRLQLANCRLLIKTSLVKRKYLRYNVKIRISRNNFETPRPL